MGSLSKPKNNEFIIIQDQIEEYAPILPNEILEMLFNYLKDDKKSLIACRGVSKRWLIQIDYLNSFGIVVDDRKFSGYSNKLTSDISISSCTIKSLRYAPNRRIFEEYNCPEKLTIYHRIDKWNMFMLTASTWNQKITQLSFGWRVLAGSQIFSSIKDKNNLFPQLKVLSLDLLSNTDVIKGYNICLNNANYIFSLIFPKLKEINFTFYFNNVHYEILAAVTNYIKTNACQLEKIGFKMGFVYKKETASENANLKQQLVIFNNFGINHGTNFDNLTDIEYNSWDLYHKTDENDEDNARKLAQWRDLLQNEKDLKVLISEKILNIHLRLMIFYRDPITNIAAYLYSIELYNISVYPQLAGLPQDQLVFPVNLANFSQCLNLKKLSLWRAPIIVSPSLDGMNDTFIELANIHSLPISIENLTLEGFPGLTHGLTRLIVSMVNLKTLQFTSVITLPSALRRNCGVNVDGLTKIINHPTLLRADFSMTKDTPTCIFPIFENELKSNYWEKPKTLSGINKVLVVKMKRERIPKKININ